MEKKGEDEGNYCSVHQREPGFAVTLPFRRDWRGTLKKKKGEGGEKKKKFTNIIIERRGGGEKGDTGLTHLYACGKNTIEKESGSAFHVL